MCNRKFIILLIWNWTENDFSQTSFDNREKLCVGKAHDRFMTEDTRRPDRNKKPKSFIDFGKSNVREMAFLMTPMTLV